MPVPDTHAIKETSALGFSLLILTTYAATCFELTSVSSMPWQTNKKKD